MRNEIPFCLGRNLDKGGLVTFLRSQLTTPHFCFLGVSGCGKSTLLSDLIWEIICRGEGVTVVDPGGDLVDNLSARMARRVIDTNDSTPLKNFHRFEPGDYTMAFGWDPAKFVPAKPIHPEHRSNAFRAWLHTTVQNSGEWVQLKQGQMDFEQNARLHRILTRAFTAGFMDVGGQHLALPLVWILFDPDYPGSEEALAKIAPSLDAASVSDIRRIRSYRRVEDRMRETESFINRLHAILPPQAKAIFSSRHVVPLRQIILDGGAMLWQLRPTEFFSHDAKATFGKIAIHSVISTMMSMPPEMRVRHTLVIDESSEFANEFLLWALGALRKTGLSIWLCGQDLSSWRKKELDMVPKVLSETNVVCFQQDWYEDVEILLRKIFAGDIEFAELMNEVERHHGYEMVEIQGSSESINVTHNYSQGEKYEESETKGRTTGKQKGTGRTRSTSSSRSETEGDVDTLSRPITGNNRPEQRSHADSSSRTRLTGDTEGESSHETESESNSESQATSRGRNASRGAGIGKTTGTSRSMTPLVKVVREKVKTGTLETDLQVQYAKLAAKIQTQKKRQAFVKIIGEEHAVRMEALEVKPPFLSATAQMKAIDGLKRELFATHSYNFVPNYDPSEEENLLRAFLGEAPQEAPEVEPDVVMDCRGYQENGVAANSEESTYGI